MHAAQRLRGWLYKWLPIFMGCHCRADRTFHYHGKPFPVCARCTGILLGFLISICAIGWRRPHALWLFVMLLPMIADGLIQHRTKYESTNPRRFVTGLFWGYAAMTLLLLSFVWTFRFGLQLGKRMGLSPSGK